MSEATVICVDNSEWTRNGDYPPNRLRVQQECATYFIRTKLEQNPENSVGVVSLGSKFAAVLVALTTDVTKLMSSVTGINVSGSVHFLSGLQVAQLALQYRKNRHQRQRIVCFVGSPLEESEKELVSVGKRLKKANVAVDIVSFGEVSVNTEKLDMFIQAVNRNDNGQYDSHLITVPPGPHNIVDILLSSPLFQRDVSNEGSAPSAFAASAAGGMDEDEAIRRAIELSLQDEETRNEGGSGEVVSEASKPADSDVNQNFHKMSEEEQIALAMQLSMQEESKDDVDALMEDTDFIQSVVSTLPGVHASHIMEGEKEGGEDDSGQMSTEEQNADVEMKDVDKEDSGNSKE